MEDFCYKYFTTIKIFFKTSANENNLIFPDLIMKRLFLPEIHFVSSKKVLSKIFGVW